MENAHLNSDFLLRKLRGNKTYPAHGVCPQRLLQEWLHQDLGPLHRLLRWMVEAQIFGWVNIEAQTCGCCLTVRSHRRLTFLFLNLQGKTPYVRKECLGKMCELLLEKVLDPSVDMLTLNPGLSMFGAAENESGTGVHLRLGAPWCNLTTWGWTESGESVG